MKKILGAVLIGIVLMTAGCTLRFEKTKPLVMATLFPQYDFARWIAEDAIELEFLLPRGTSAHAYEPSPRTVVRILNADLLIYTGDAMEPWVNNLIRGSAGSGLTILDVSKDIDLIGSECDHGHDDDEEDCDDHHHDDNGHGHDEDHDDNGHDHDDHAHIHDPHIWQDPLNAIQMVESILAALIELLPEMEATFTANAGGLIGKLADLHADYLDLAAKSELNVIMHGGHNAFGYFANRYGFEYHTPYSGFSTEDEPTPKQLAHMIDLMEAYDIEVLFSERLIASHVADTIAEATDATILYLYAAGNIPEQAYQDGTTFIDMMRHNLEKFRIGLRHQEGD